MTERWPTNYCCMTQVFAQQECLRNGPCESLKFQAISFNAFTSNTPTKRRCICMRADCITSPLMLDSYSSVCLRGLSALIGYAAAVFVA